MRVSIIAPVDPLVERPGGTRTYVMSLINSLTKADIDFSLIGVDFDETDGSPSHEFVPAVSASKISSVKFLRGLMKVAKRHRLTDDTIIHAQRPDYLFPFIFRKHKNKKLCTLHGQMLRSVKDRKGRFYSSAYGLLESYSMKRADYAIAVDQSTLSLFLTKHPALSWKSALIPVGIDLENWIGDDSAQVRKRLGFSNKQKLGLYVGRLEREKRVDMIIESVNLVRDALGDFSLSIIGDGMEQERLEDLARRMAPESVSFMGPQPTSVVRDMMTAADVFCLASSFESGPLVVLESLASGTPVVATDVGRVREFLQESSVGRIIAPSSPEEANARALADAIIDLMNSDRVNIARECVERAREFSFDKTFERTLEIYENLSRRSEW